MQSSTTRSKTTMQPRRMARLALMGLATTLLVGLGTAPVTAGPPPVNQQYRDSVHKFSLKVFRDYERVPQKADEETVVAAFRDPKGKGQARGTYDVVIRVVRVGKGPVVTGGLADIDGDSTREELMEAMRAARRPTSAWDATMGNLHQRLSFGPNGPAPGLDQEDFKKIKSKDKAKYPGKLYHFDLPIQGGTESIHAALGVFTRPDQEIEYGVFCYCGDTLAKKYKSRFDQIIKSFKWFDKRADDVETLDVLEGVNITAKKRRQIERGMVKGWSCIVSPKKNYIVLYNTNNGKNKLLAKVIAERIEKIREQVYEVQFPPSKPIKDVSIVRVCKDRMEYMGYGAPGGSAGYWSPGDRELVFYDASPSKKPDDDTLAVLYHEAFHQYIFYSVGNVSPHSWFNEGHGDYYAGAKYKGGKFKIEPFNWRVGTVKGAIVQGPRPLEVSTDAEGKETKRWGNTGYTPLKDLVNFTQREYYSYPGVSYAQGWALIYFLREIVPKNKKYREKWGHILDTYFDVLKAEVNKDEDFLKSLEEPGEGEDGEGDEEEEGDREPGDGPSTPTSPTTPDDEGGDTPPADDAPPSDDNDEAANNAPPPTGGFGPQAALDRAVQEAFKGIDWEEFEAAWINGTKRGR